MRSNIGPIVDFILPYTSQLRISSYHNRPFMEATISNTDMISKGIIYVLQTAPEEFAYIDADCAAGGFRFLPQNNVVKPFIMEHDYVRQKFGGRTIDKSWYDSMLVGIPSDDIIRQIIKRMEFYEVIRYKTTSGTTALESMDISSTRIRRAIEKAFKDAGRYTGNISDLIDIVVISHQPFQLTGLKEKELQCVQKRLKSIGILSTMDTTTIASLHFERK